MIQAGKVRKEVNKETLQLIMILRQRKLDEKPQKKDNY